MCVVIPVLCLQRSPVGVQAVAPPASVPRVKARDILTPSSNAASLEFHQLFGAAFI